jgi:hypothetical protein
MLSTLLHTEEVTILQPTNSRTLLEHWALFSNMVPLMINWALRMLPVYGSSMTDQNRNVGNTVAMGGSFPRLVTFYDTREKSQERHRSRTVRNAVQSSQEPLPVMVSAASAFTLELLLTKLRSHCAR